MFQKFCSASHRCSGPVAHRDSHFGRRHNGKVILKTSTPLRTVPNSHSKILAEEDGKAMGEFDPIVGEDMEMHEQLYKSSAWVPVEARCFGF